MRLILAGASIALAAFQAASGQAPLTMVGTIDLPGVEGRIDHLAVDLAEQRLYVSALGNNREVLDLKNNRHARACLDSESRKASRSRPMPRSSRSRTARARACSSSIQMTIAQYEPSSSEMIPTTFGTTRRRSVCSWGSAAAPWRPSVRPMARSWAKQSSPAIPSHSSSNGPVVACS